MSRPLWKGSISFGLVNVPIELVMAVREKSIHFHMLTKDGGCRLRRKLVCPDSGKEYDFHETGRGVEVAPGEYALVDEKEINRLRPDRGRTIEIEQFVDLNAIDPVYFNRTYYVVPVKDSLKGYRLLVEAMTQGKRCALGRFVMRQKQYVAALRPLEGGLVLHTLFYASEVLDLPDALPNSLSRVKVAAAELSVAQELLKSMTHPLNMEKFRDDYREDLQKLIDTKVKGKKLVKTADEEPSAVPAPTVNLMDALRRSLAAPGKRPAVHARPTARRRPVARRARSAS